MASDPATGMGAVHWFQAMSMGNVDFEWAGVINAPLSVSSGFGRAIAVPPVLDEPGTPWDPSPAPVPWVAIGSENPANVWLYMVSPGLSAPLTSLMNISAPSGAAPGSFGEIMTVGDFDGDGYADLAVAWSASSDPAVRYVSVYWGQTGLAPLALTGATVVAMDDVPFAEPFGTPTMTPAGSDFATSLAAGSMIEGDSRDLLAAGAPGAVLDGGAVCWYRFSSSREVDDGQCRYNPLDQPAFTAGDRFGASVGFGKVYPVDEALSFDTPAAEVDELVVGAPGRGGTGLVVAFPSNGSGPSFQRLRADMHPLSHESGYGAQVTTGYVQRTPWEDIVSLCTGCDSTRRAEVSRALLPDDSTSCPNPSGQWLVADDNGLSRRVSISLSSSDSTRIVFEEPFAISLRESGGTGPICIVGPEEDIEVRATIAAGTVLSIPSHGNCTAAGRVFDDVPPGPVVVTVLGSLGVWDEMPGLAQNYILNTDVILNIDIVEPVGNVPASLVLDFDISTMPLKEAAYAYPNYNLHEPECNTPPYGGSNLDGTFGIGVCE